MEQGASCKRGKGAVSRQMIIFEQGAQKIKERGLEQKEILKRSMEQKNKSRSKKKHEKGAGSTEK